jgi:DeoR/GlpR family transcriptional regulator of sugar metabolism
VDGGTTNAALARALPRHFGFTLVTHSPTIAAEMEKHPTAEVVLIGGRLYKHSMVAVGAIAAEAISRLRPDIFFMGATAIHSGHGFSTGDIEEAAIKRLIAGQAAETWVLATLAKLDAVSPVTIMPADAATGMIVAAGDEADAVLTDFERAGLRIKRA